MLAVVMLACGGGSGSPAADGPTPCPSVEPLSEKSLLPEEISFEDYGTVIGQEVEKGFLITEARSDLKVVELDPVIQRDLLEEGFEILSHDNEGFEAEIFFARGQEFVGTFTLRDLCEGQIRVKLVLGGKRYEGKRG
jgi:hypothetical protein